MFLCISSRSDASCLKQSAAVVALSIADLTALFHNSAVSGHQILYIPSLLLVLFAGQLPAAQVHLVNRAGSQIVLVRRLLPQLLSKVNRAQLNELQTNLTLVAAAAG